MDEDKALTYEEAKQLCQMAFDAGVDYHSTSVQFNCNAVAYDWEHWLKRNEGLFRPKPTVEDVLAEMLDVWSELPSNVTNEAIIAEYAAKLRLAGEDA